MTLLVGVALASVAEPLDMAVIVSADQPNEQLSR